MIREMIEGLVDGISGRKREKMEPLGRAVETLIAVINESNRKGLTSPTLEAAHVVLDNNKMSREALDSAAFLVNHMTELLTGKEPPTGKDMEKFAVMLEDFRAKAVKARLHQYVPYHALPGFHAKLNQ